MQHYRSHPSRRMSLTALTMSGLLQKLNVDPPPVDSPAWNLWMDPTSQSLAQNALDTAYIQGIKNGNLDPGAYGGYSVQDYKYCSDALKDYRKAHSIAKKLGGSYDIMASFIHAKIESYKHYNESVSKQWHLRGASSISLSPPFNSYAESEAGLVSSDTLIYFIVAMIPCEQLWAWLADQLQPSIQPGNVYGFWVNDNLSWHGAYLLDNFVNTWVSDGGSYDPQVALTAYQASLNGEFQCFSNAWKPSS